MRAVFFVCKAEIAELEYGIICIGQCIHVE